MILNSKKERKNKLYDYIHTLLALEDEDDFRIIEIRDTASGFSIDYKVYEDPTWESKTILLTPAQILLIEFTKSNN